MPRSVLLFNKPYGVLSQFTDRAGRKTLKDYISSPDVYAAGRLDRDSEGLLILTNDKDLTRNITDPNRKMTKTYWVQVEGLPTSVAIARLESGLVLKDGPCLPAHCEKIREPHLIWPRYPPIRTRESVPDSWLSITLREGRNRQVRRMCAAINFPVLRLIRYRVGSWTLDGIDPGKWRILH